MRFETKKNIEFRKWLTVISLKELRNMIQNAVYHCGCSFDLRKNRKIHALHVCGIHLECKDFCDKIGAKDDSTAAALRW